MLLKQLHRKELQHQLNEAAVIKDVPLWRIVRYYTRLYYLNAKVGYVANTGSERHVGPRKIKVFSGFWKYLSQKNLNILFTFNRLVYNNGEYLDKFLDPVIEESFLCKERFIIVDSRNYTGNYPRLHKSNTISNEYRTISRQILHKILILITPLLYNSKVNRVFNIAKKDFELPDSFIQQYYKSIALFLTDYYYYRLWFSLLRPKRVLFVYREGYFGLIAACKKLHIPVAEFQHGITLGETVSYTGDYDHRIDPDYFITFGEFWKGVHFGMPAERVYCAGWAYSKYLKKFSINNSEIHRRDVLVISSPEISDNILNALQELSSYKGDYCFNIRLHPCESYSESQLLKLKTICAAKVVDNKTDSAVVLPTYKYVVGENSSVIYEALSVGCKVGVLHMCNLKPAIDIPGVKESFYIINNVADFKRFIEEDSVNSNDGGFYSVFDEEKFKDFLEKKM